MDEVLSVVLEYRLSNSNDWVAQTVAPEQYFDLEVDEIPELDSVPQHNHACDYLSFPLASLAETRIVLIAKELGTRRIILETFWNEGLCRLIERTDQGSDPYREIIVCSEVQSVPNKLEVLRMIDQSGHMTVTSHVIIETLEDGTEHEVQVLQHSNI